MKRMRLFAHVRFFARRRPILFMFTVLFVVGILYFTLEQFAWGEEINRFVKLLFSAEVFLWDYYEDGITWYYALGLLVLADIVSFTFDYFITRQLFFAPRVKILLNLIWEAGKRILGISKVYLKQIKEMLPSSNRHAAIVGGRTSSGRSWNPLINAMKDFSRDPTKANLFWVRVFAATPRIFTVVIGGTAVAVGLVNLNSYGRPGWRAVIEGMIIRTIGTVAFYEIVFGFIPWLIKQVPFWFLTYVY